MTKLHLKDQINPKHTVITEGGRYRMLMDDDILEPTDETGCVSCLLHIEQCFGTWVSVNPTWKDDFGKRIDEILNEDSQDIDWPDRIFRRKV